MSVLAEITGFPPLDGKTYSVADHIQTIEVFSTEKGWMYFDSNASARLVLWSLS